jgi:hypothetical protein
VTISTLDIAWAAGFIEGEGCFSQTGTSAQVTAAQVQKEPIERLQRIFGGTVTQRQTRGFSEKAIWIWRLNVTRSVQVMMTLYVLMSPKRKREIELSLERWKANKRILRSHGSTTCTKGHSLLGYNGLRVGPDRQYVHCRICKNARKRELRAGRKGSA